MSAISKSKAKTARSTHGSQKSVEVTVLGQKLLIKPTDDPERIERLADFVNRKMNEVSLHGPVSSAKLVILTALNIADEYYKLLEESRQFKRQVAQRSRLLLGELDNLPTA